MTTHYRALVRIVGIMGKHVLLVVPAWNHRVLLCLPLCDIPLDASQRFAPNYRFHVPVNIGAERKEDITFKWAEAELPDGVWTPPSPA